MSVALKITLGPDTRRIRLENPSLAAVRVSVQQIFAKTLKGSDFQLYYVDEEGDEILVGHDCELSEAVGGNGDLKLFVRQTDGQFVAPPAEVPVAVVEEQKEEAAQPQPQPPSPSQQEEEGSTHLEEEKKEEQKEEQQPETVPLSDILGEEVLAHPFFLSLREDFLHFAHDVRASIPPDFPEHLRGHFENTFRQVQESINVFVKSLENYREMRVPEAWKTHPFVVQMSKSITEGQENIQTRMKRWEEAQAMLEEMGFTEYPFIQKFLIVQHDGNLKLVVNDLLVRNGQADRINSTFERLSQSILHLFQAFAQFIQVHGTKAIHAVGGQVNQGLRTGAQYIQHQVEVNRDTIQGLQCELDKNVRFVHDQVQRMNQGGEKVASNVNNGFHHAVTRSNERIQKLQQRGAQFSFATLGVLSDTIRQLGTLFVCASREVSQEQPRHRVFVCGLCQGTIYGARYLCGACDNVTLCDVCEVSHDPSHVLVKVRTTNEIQAQPFLTEECVSLINSQASSSSSSGSSVSAIQMIQMEEIEPASVPQKQEPEPVPAPVPVAEPVPEPVPEPAPEPVPEPVVVDPQEVAMRNAIAALKEMGFSDDVRSRELLLQNNMELEAVVAALLG